MHLVQVLLPLYDDEGRRFPHRKYASLRKTLTDRFGGATIYSRAPAEGVWSPNERGEKVVRDDIVIFETMVEDVDRAWWRRLKSKLEKSFRQDEIVVRASAVDVIQ